MRNLDKARGNPPDIDLSDLNPAQREAVCSVDGPLLVLAGAGTGKTRVITCRVAWLIAQGVEPANILALTFTNKAAREMKERIAGMVAPQVAEQVLACTFHSFGARLLRRHISRLGYTESFDIADEYYCQDLIKMILGELSLRGKEGVSPERYKHEVSRAKNRLLNPADIDEKTTSWPLAFAEVYSRYLERMKAMNMVDFDDLLVLVVHLWRDFPSLLEACRKQYKYLLVDEYQDTNHTQFVMTSMLAGSRANLCVVGDDDQSIYGWRGAAVGNILDFQNHFPGARAIRLEQNYRSTTTILEAANHVIANNGKRHVKALWSQQGEGDKITVVRAENESKEAEFIADLIRERLAVRGGSLRDFAVLYRSNHLSRPLEQAMKQADLRYYLIGGRSFYQRKDILDALSFLQLVWNRFDDQSLLRVLNVPPRGIGGKAVERLLELRKLSGRPLQELLVEDEFVNTLSSAAGAAVRELADCIERYRRRFGQPGGMAEKIRAYLADIGYLDGLMRLYRDRKEAANRRENVLELINSAADYEERSGSASDLGGFLETFALRDQNDRVENASATDSGVGLMTVHAAKGLEFPVVIVAGMEADLFPHHNSLKEGGMEEERRLFYVAATRAREELYLTHTVKRRVQGTPRIQRPSLFLREIPVRHSIETDPENAFQAASSEEAADYMRKLKEMFSVEP